MSKWLFRTVRVGLAAAVMACGDSSSPSDEGPSLPLPVAIGDTVTVRVEPGSMGTRYLIRSDSAVDIAVFLQTLEGDGVAFLADSISGIHSTMVVASADPAPDHLLMNRTDVIRVPADETWLLLLRRNEDSIPTRVRFLVYPVNRAPEMVPATLTLGDTLAGETLENSADIDEFQLPATAGEEFIAAVRTAPGATALAATVELHQPGAPAPFVGADANGPNADLEFVTTGGVAMTSTGTMRVSVRGTGLHLASPGEGRGPFQLMVRQIHRAPESVGATLPVNDTLVGERVEHVGDVDEFTVTLEAAERYRLFLQTTDGFTGSVLRLSLPTLGIAVLSTVGDSALAGNSSPTFSPSVTGPVLVRVEGIQSAFGGHRGGYRLFLYQVNPLPELVAGLIPAGDSILAETIEFPGDVDSFTVTPGPTGFVNYLLRPSASYPATHEAYYASITPFSLRCFGTGTTLCGGGTHHITPPGEWLRVEGAVGRYEFLVRAIDTIPEGVPPGLVRGQTVLEAIDPIGDSDRYQVSVNRGEQFDFEFTGGNSSTSDAFGFLWLLNGSNNIYGGSGPSWRTGRFTFPFAGDYTLVIQGANVGGSTSEIGPYQFKFSAVSVGPETASPSITTLDTVSAEATDSLGDVDEFMVAGPAGQEFVVQVPPALALAVLDPVTPDTVILGLAGASGVLVMPASGQLRLAVYEERASGFQRITAAYQITGPYTLALRPLDRGPEAVPATVTRGVQVAEQLDYVGDVDEFSFAAVTGDTASIVLADPVGLRLQLEVVSPVDGAVITTGNTEFQTLITLPTVTFPATGSYTIRVRGVYPQEGRGAYDFTVR